jgi:hypothetical protein
MKKSIPAPPPPKQPPAKPAPAPPAASTPAPPATPPAQLDQRTLDIILASDIANIVKKVKAGKPLSASEREILKQRLINAPVPGTPAANGSTGGGATIPSLLDQLKELISKPKNKGGRPKFRIDYQMVERLANLQCTQEEIASVLGCHSDTLQRDARFCALYKKGMAAGAITLRRHQWRAVEEQRDVTMMIFLGKQYLRQMDRQHVEVEPVAPEDLTQDQIKQLTTPELRRIIALTDPEAAKKIIDITPIKALTNGSNGSNNGKNGH